MAIQHKDIPEQELHEPKGASLAAPNTVYVADGAGSGDWVKIDTLSIQGLGSQAGQSNQIVVSDGSGGFMYSPDASYASLVINNNTASFAVTAATDPSLNTNTDYKILGGAGATWAPDLVYGMGITSDSIIVGVDGIYDVKAWLDIATYPAYPSKIALKYVVNGNQYGIRKVVSKVETVGDIGKLIGFGLVQLTSGDIVQLALASTDSGSVILDSGNVVLNLIRTV